jgi:5S rRNA maturation endonuclease (ribonuclease M5)
MLVRARRQGIFFPSGSSKLLGAKPMTPQQLNEQVIAERNAKKPQEFKILPSISANQTVHEIALQIIAENPLDEFCRKEGIALKREGALLAALCPLHEEDTPSFKVYSDNHFYCYGCHKHGDVIDLYQYRHKCDFKETARHFGHDASRAERIPVAIYDYLDENGKLNSQILRFNYPKDFLVRHKLANGEWDPHKPDRVIPYHLDEIVKAENEIYIVEGEKDADTLRNLHLVATCNPFGGGKWRQDFDQYFHGRTIYICPDTDKGGQEHCKDVGKKLLHVAKEIHVVDIPHEFKDVTELYENDPASFEERLRAACKAARPFADFQGNGDHPGEGGKSQGLPEIISAAQMCAVRTPLPPEVVAGILHKGSKMVLGGGSKSFKTWTLLELALCVASGNPWLGKFPTTRGNVIYINFEIQRCFMEARTTAICAAFGIEIPSNLDFWNLRGHSTSIAQIVPKIIERLKGRDYLLLILDPLYKLLGDKSENVTEDITHVMNEIERIAVNLGPAVSFGSHFSKGNQSSKDAIDRISGSGVFARDPDTIITLTEHDEEEAFTVDLILRNFAPIKAFTIKRDHPLMRLAPELDPLNIKQKAGRPKSVTKEQVLECLEGDMRPKEWKEAAQQKGYSEDAWERRKEELVRDRKVFKSNIDGKYSRL